MVDNAVLRSARRQ